MNNTLDNTYKMALRIKGITGEIDTTITKLILGDSEDGNKTIVSETVFNQGSIITIDNKKFIVTTFNDRLNQTPYYKGILERAYPCKCNDKTFYSIVEMNKNVMIETGVVSILNDRYSFVTSNTETIKLNDIIWFKDNDYKVISVDNTKDGILTIYTKFDKYSPQVNYSISLVNSNASIKETESYQIECICTKDGIDVTNPIVMYTSGDELIATVSPTGLVKALKEGTTNITCTYETKTVDFSITVVKGIVVVKQFVVSGLDRLKINTTTTYTVVNKDGSPLDGREFIFELDSYTIKNKVAEIVSYNVSSCILKALKSDEIVELIVKDKLDVTQTVTKVIDTVIR